MTWTLVTGGAKRLGAEICRTLAGQGHSIVVHFRTSQREAEEVAAFCRTLGVDAETLHGDFSTRKSTEDFLSRYLERFSDTQYLVNNVGSYLKAPASETTMEEWEAVFQSNTHAPFLLMRGLAESLKRHQGAVVNLGIAGLETCRADLYSTAYTSAKLSLLKLTRSLAREWAPFHVRVNMVSPGYLENAVDLPQDPASLPMRRPATLSEVCTMIAYLFSPDSNYITGQNIEIAGGVRL
ncbi:MAG: SDR family oxidoreductase [Parachlamydia sp.]|nr:SDR family oxidoreductase [Parachlamydia sp.]